MVGRLCFPRLLGNQVEAETCDLLGYRVLLVVVEYV
jgi:hypothetical protein